MFSLEVAVRINPEIGALMERNRARLSRAAAAALYIEAEEIMATAKEYCPVDTGALRASGQVHPPVTKPDGTVEVRAGFGNSAVTYAVYVHERRGLNHPVGRDHFLEDALMEAVPGIDQRFAYRLALGLLTE